MFFTDILEEFNDQTLSSSWFGIIKDLREYSYLKVFVEEMHNSLKEVLAVV